MKKTLATLFVAALTLLSALASAETYAVIIGINDYPEPVGADGKPLLDKDGKPESDDLYGCVNDAKFWQELLTKQFGVNPNNVHMLLDKNATDAAFTVEMAWLVVKAKPGDRVFIGYSGHGGQVKLDDQPEEEDGLTEVLCLQDILVPDNFIADLVNTFRDAGVDTTVALDSCFSGGMARDVDKKGMVRRSKFLPSARMSVKQKSNHLTAIEEAQITMGVKTNRGVAKGSYAYLLAGQEDQPTSDLEFKDGSPAHGAFTFLVMAVLEDDPKMTVEKLIEEVKGYLKKYDFEQVPKAEYSDKDRSTKPVIG